LQAYIDGSAQECAALFAEHGGLELPYLADLGVGPRYEGPKEMGEFLILIWEKIYPGFKKETRQIQFSCRGPVLKDYWHATHDRMIELCHPRISF
jgi:hypothetical protein